jgi:Nickel responsive protein SCO4226-like
LRFSAISPAATLCLACAVAEFLVELYIPRTGSAAAKRGAAAARRAAEALTRDGTPVHFLRSIFLPEDETCFLLYEAATIGAVRKAARRARLRVERICAAAEGDGERSKPRPSGRRTGLVAPHRRGSPTPR